MYSRSDRTLLLDGLGALERGREDAILRVLEVKATAGEASTEVTDLAMRVCGVGHFGKRWELIEISANAGGNGNGSND